MRARWAAFVDLADLAVAGRQRHKVCLARPEEMRAAGGGGAGMRWPTASRPHKTCPIAPAHNLSSKR